MKAAANKPSYSGKIVQEQIVLKVILTCEQDFLWKWVCWGFSTFGNLSLQNQSPLKPHFTQKNSSQYTIKQDNNI